MIDTDTEVLYLARGERDVLVEKCPKRQDVIDGIRFIYRQYVKKKPGVILNEPERSVNIKQTVLFINSVRSLLERPSLVLCDEGVERKWLDHFQAWSDMGHDVTADTINPFRKKVSVYITPVTEMGKFYSRDWSVVVVDSDIVHKEILRDKLSARYKIWITGVNVKENLNIFSQLYKWLYPKQAFDANLFRCDKNDLQESFVKAIKLEAFMEDIVLNNNTRVNINSMSSSTPPQLTVTRKNKDATGTKIKRTKRKNTILSSEENSPNKVTKPAEVSICNTERNSFNVDEEISYTSISKSLTTNLSDTTINSSLIHIEFDDEINTGNDQRDENKEMMKTENMEVENVEVVNKTHNNEMSISEHEFHEVTVDLNAENDLKDKYDEISIQNDSNMDSDIFRGENDQNDDNNSMNLILQYDEESTPLIIDETKSNDSDYDKDTQKNELDNVQYFNAINTNLNEIEHKITDSKTNLNEIDKNEIEIVDKKPNIESENLFSTESISNLNKTKDELNKNNNKDEVNKVENVENNKTDFNIDSVEYKMKQIEELAMKKFKGSLLDSLF